MNTERFTGRVAEYARYRTRPPVAVVEWLRERCGLTPEWVIADVGAGTGMLAELFLENGNPVTAVEPNAEMRSVCEGLRERFAGLQVVGGTAEGTTIGAGSVDMVSVGRAFHWFDPAGAAAEFKRVLKPGGWVAIISSGRERGRETEQGRAFQDLLLRYGTDAPHVRSWVSRAEETVEFLRALARGAEPKSTEFVTERKTGLEEFLGETQSLSVVPLAGTAEYARMREALQDFFARWSVDGLLQVRSVYRVSAGRMGG